MRPSGRRPDELRSIDFKTNFTRYAEGSVLAEFGETRVLCTASVENRVPHWLRGQHDTLAVRVTAHPLAARLCTAYGGALVSTSANVSGRPAARTRLRVQQQFMGAIDYILPGATGPRTRPSEIRDGATGARVRL